MKCYICRMWTGSALQLGQSIGAETIGNWASACVGSVCWNDLRQAMAGLGLSISACRPPPMFCSGCPPFVWLARQEARYPELGPQRLLVLAQDWGPGGSLQCPASPPPCGAPWLAEELVGSRSATRCGLHLPCPVQKPNAKLATIRGGWTQRVENAHGAAASRGFRFRCVARRGGGLGYHLVFLTLVAGPSKGFACTTSLRFDEPELCHPAEASATQTDESIQVEDVDPEPWPAG